jgi:hypothetical protein
MKRAEAAMTELEEIEARADQWYRFMLSEVDQAIRQAFEDTGKPAKQTENSQN